MTFVPPSPGSEHQQTTRPTARVKELQQSMRTRGEDPVPAAGHNTGNIPQDFRQINGWGADLDPKNRPSVPAELPSDVKTARGEVKHWQKPHMKIYVSNEQPGLTPVFGETCPPRGLSKLLRDYAYEYGEGTNRRWLTLMLADRVDVWESALIDSVTGRTFDEKAWGTKLKNDPKRSIIAAAGVVGAVMAAVFVLRQIGKR